MMTHASLFMLSACVVLMLAVSLVATATNALPLSASRASRLRSRVQSSAAVGLGLGVGAEANSQLGFVEACASDTARTSLWDEYVGPESTRSAFKSTFGSTTSCPTVPATTEAQLIAAVKDTTYDCRWIRIKADITLNQDLTLTSNTVLDGRGTGGILRRKSNSGAQVIFTARKNIIIIGVTFVDFSFDFLALGSNVAANAGVVDTRSGGLACDNADSATSSAGYIFMKAMSAYCYDGSTLKDGCSKVKKSNGVALLDDLCVLAIDVMNERKTIRGADGNRNVWIHRNTFSRSGEAVQFDDKDNKNSGSGPVTMSYNYFRSCSDSTMLEQAGIFIVHHNAYVSTLRRNPKCNHPSALCHIYNNVIVNFYHEARTVHAGTDVDEHGFFYLSSQPDTSKFSSPYNSEAIRKSSTVAYPESQIAAGITFNFDFTSITGDKEPSNTYAYTVQHSTQAGCIEAGTEGTCEVVAQWWASLLRPNGGGAYCTQLSGAFSAATTCALPTRNSQCKQQYVALDLASVAPMIL